MYVGQIWKEGADYEYDELNRLTKLTNYIDNGTTVGQYDASDLLRGSYEYEVDVFHKRTSAIEKVNAGSTNATTVTSEIDWAYDALGGWHCWLASSANH